MKTPLVFSVALTLIVGSTALAQSTVYVSPDVPTVDPGGSTTVFLPWQVIAYTNGTYSTTPEVSLPPHLSIDAVHKLDLHGHWLLSLEAPAELPPGSSTFYQPEDVVLWDGSGYTMVLDGSAAGVPPGSNIDAVFRLAHDAGPLVVGFDVPTTLGAQTYEPADLVQYSAGTFTPFFDASAAGTGIAPSDNAIGADESGGRVLLAMDVPSDLLPSVAPVPYLPGQLAAWDGAAFDIFESLGGWPLGSAIDAFSGQANPGLVADSLMMDRSQSVPGNVVVSWAAGCSSGAEDYGLYEGTLSSLQSGAYDHAPIACNDTGTALVEDLPPAAGNTYYLVVPHNVAEEGSYGTDYDPDRVPAVLERPQSASACFAAVQVVTACP